MRDPKRIPEILKRIETIWLKNPDLRLGQLIGNFLNVQYLYEIEDEKLLTFLENNYDRIDSELH